MERRESLRTRRLNEHLSSAASIVLSLWFSLSGLAAVIGNAVVLWFFYKNESTNNFEPIFHHRLLSSVSDKQLHASENCYYSQFVYDQ